MAESSKDVERPSGGTQKKVPIESLSHEELVKKCKTLLIISQKAKQAKDDITEEVKNLKHELNIHCQESQNHKLCSEKLANQLRKVAEEKENVLLAIESVKLNNGELQNIVRKISSERDALFEEVNQLNVEKQKLMKVIASTGEENDSVIEENRTLKSEKRKLNEELFASMSLQEVCTAKMKSLEVEVEKLLEESKLLVHHLQLKDIPVEYTEPCEGTDNVVGNLSNLLSVFSKKFHLISSYVKSKRSIDNQTSLPNNSVNDSIEESEAGTGSVLTAGNALDPLNEEIERLNKIVEEFKTESVMINEENKLLKGKIDRLQSENNEYRSSLHETENIHTELRTELDSARQVSAQKATEIALLKDEISLLMEHNKEQVVNLMEMKGLRNEIQKLQNLLTNKESELKALKEAYNDEIKLQLMSERQCFESQIKDLEVSVNSKDVEIAKLNLDIKNAEKIQEKYISEVEVLRQEIQDLQGVVEEMQLEKEKIVAEVSRYISEIQSMKEEIRGNQIELENKQHEIEIVKQEREDNSKNVLDMALIHKERDDLQTLLDSCQRELETIKSEFEKNSESYHLELEQLQSKITEFQKTKAEKEHENDSVKETISTCKLENESLKQEFKHVLESLSEKDKEIVCISQERKTIQQDNEKNLLAMKELDRNVSYLKQQLNDKDQQIVSMEQEITKIGEINKKYSDEILCLKNEIATLQKGFEEVESQLTIIKGEKIELERAKSQADSEVTRLNEETVEWEIKFKEKEEKCKEADKLAERMDKALKRLQGEVLKQYKQLEENRHKIASITQEREVIIENNILTHSTGIEALQKEVASLQRNMTQKEKDISNIQAEKELELSTMQEKLTHKEQEIVTVLEALEKNKIKLSNLQASFAELQLENATIQDCLREKEQIIMSKQSDLTEKEVQVTNLQKSLVEKEQEVLKLVSDKGSTGIEDGNVKLSQEIETLQKEISSLRNHLESKEQQMLEIMTENESKYPSETTALKEKIVELNNTVQIKNVELSKAHEQEQTVTEYSESLLREQQLNKDKTSEIEFLQSECKQYAVTINKMQKEFTEQLKVADERYNSKQENLVDELVNIQNSSAETEATLTKVRTELEAMKAVQEEVVIVRRENSELLGEMNEMNQVLKKRGETVSKLEKLNSELEKKLKDTTASLETERQALDTKTSELASRDAEIAHLRAEVVTLLERAEARERDNKDVLEEVGWLRARLQQLEREVKEGGDTMSEAMSCSTLGRAEESSRLKDVEDTFEERYTKLRTIAVKLKKRVAELTAQVASLEADKTRLTSDLQAKVAQLSGNAKNIQTIQQEYDRQQDLVDAQKQELKEIKRALEAAVTDATDVKQKLVDVGEEKEKLTSDLEFCTVAKLAVETQVKELTAEIQDLKKEKGERDTEIKKLKDEIKKCEQMLKEEEKKHRTTLADLDRMRQEMKKNSVLCLEMSDYEKSVAELSGQVSMERARVSDLTAHLESQQEIADGLREQIRLLEEGLAAEEARSGEVGEQLGVLRARLSEAAAVSSEREADISRLKTEVESRREEAERATLLLSQVAAEKQKLEEGNRSRMDVLTSQLRQTEDELKACRAQLSGTVHELSRLGAEFEGYKVRAQSVLRQKARPDDGNREDCVEEIAQLRHAADVTRAKLEETSSRLLAANGEITTLQQDRDRILERCRQLSENVASLTTENQQLSEKGKEAATEHREAAGRQKIHYETLVQCYKTQLEETEERLTSENAILRDQIDRLEARLGRSARDDVPDPTKAAAFVPVQSPLNEIPMLEREEGEGSESVHSTSPQNSSQGRHELMPLDKLLALQPEDEAVRVTSISPASELSKVRDHLGTSERQVRHLSGLLAEAEQDLARLTQLNDVLKEEIRRNQRSEEREKHAHNQEYLKNVIFKFVTLQGGDERSRLVPVLNTLLKLSPEETKQLSSVAKAGAERQATGGWGNYLHLWPSTQ